jgi:asparagine synthase (glutamine-hydrolysing)
MPGPISRYQRRRRDEIVGRFGLIDGTLECANHPPFGPGSRRVTSSSVVLWGEFYDEAVGVMLDRARADGVRTIFTGMGGDELCSYQRGELAEAEGEAVAPSAGHGAVAGNEMVPSFVTRALSDAALDSEIDHAPQSLLYTSALESAAAVSALYLEHGVWPVSPLCTPELVEFCRRLPFAWRHRRTIQRRVLASLGCSRVVTHPAPHHLEHFGDVMELAMREASAELVRSLFAGSRLADRGLVDRDALLAAYTRLCAGDQRYADELLGVAMLELTLRSVEAQRAS